MERSSRDAWSAFVATQQQADSLDLRSVERAQARRWSGSIVVLVGVCVLGGVATALSVQRALEAERVADERAASVVAARLAAGLSASLFALGGADAMAVDGVVTEEEFAAFAADVLPGSDYSALAFAEAVPAGERASWEAEVGVQIVDTDGQGGFVPAATRERHVVVRYVRPDSELVRGVVGFVLRSDPVRARGVDEAATNPGGVLVGPIRLATGARPGLFAVNAVHGSGGEVVAYIASGISFDGGLLERVSPLPDLEPVGIRMDGELLIAGDASGSVATFELAGRSFEVRSSDTQGVSWSAPILLACATALICGAAGLAARRDRHDYRRQQWLLSRNLHLADLAELLVSAPSSVDVLRAAANTAGRVVDAQHTTIGRRRWEDPSTLEIIHDDGFPADLSETYSVRSVASELPLAECARESTSVFVPDGDRFRSRYPEAADVLDRAGIEAVLCVPMSLGNDSSVGAIGFTWSQAVPPRRRDDLEAAAQLVAQMVGRAYERAVVREVVQRRVEILGEFTAAVAAARSVGDINSAARQLLPEILDVEAASLEPMADEPTSSTRVHPLPSLQGEQLTLATRPGVAWTPTAAALTRAIVEILDGAMTRARLYEHEHSVLQQLQVSLLTPAPIVAGFDVAVAYRSAIEAVGIGGDWYSVIDRDDALFAVIGDIAGHGPGAVALMAQVKTIIRHLLTEDIPLVVALEHASQHLMQRNAYASALIVRIDKCNSTLTYANARHLYALVDDGSTVSTLDRTHRPLLGLPSQSADPSTTPFPVGARLLLYTDGLVEDRGTPIDDSMEVLAARFGAARLPPEQLVEQLLRERDLGRTARAVDDDIAIVAIQRTLPTERA